MPGIITSTAFKRDMKNLPQKEIEAAKAVIRALAAGEAMSARCKDHALSGNWAHYRDAHILPGLLLD